MFGGEHNVLVLGFGGDALEGKAQRVDVDTGKHARRALRCRSASLQDAARFRCGQPRGSNWRCPLRASAQSFRFRQMPGLKVFHGFPRGVASWPGWCFSCGPALVSSGRHRLQRTGQDQPLCASQPRCPAIHSRTWPMALSTRTAMAACTVGVSSVPQPMISG